ncbi:MAG: bifunctional 23S rRNA (guanine(2069)-N(7))-methyltransferase RlmK/23S rRNA (guanine(2445)-N(2))-methyltransferase RlmL [Thermoleophilia bacterium]
MSSDSTAALSLFATAPKGMEGLLADELRQLGAGGVAETRAGVAFSGTLETAYRACLWSRVANRILLPLATFAAVDADDVYAGVSTIDWSAHLTVSGTLAVDATLAGGQKDLANSRYLAQRVKDAIVDQFRQRTGTRPNVDTLHPDLRVNLHTEHGEATVSIDLAGESLHRRGYRAEGVQVEAPLKENLAAAILLRAGWPAIAAAGGNLVDPLCGSGTLPIEAALMAADVAPGLLRATASSTRSRADADAVGGTGVETVAPAGATTEVAQVGAVGATAARQGNFGFERWQQHDAALWERLVAEARERRTAGLARLREIQRSRQRGAEGVWQNRAAAVGEEPTWLINGFDHDRRAVTLARASVARAGLDRIVHIEQRELSQFVPPPGAQQDTSANQRASIAASSDEVAGLVVANPPYGERLGDTASEIVTLYSELGDRLRAGFGGWRAAVLVGDRELGHLLGLRADKLNTLYNGALKVTLLQFAVAAETETHGRVPRGRRAVVAPAKAGGAPATSGDGSGEPAASGRGAAAGGGENADVGSHRRAGVAGPDLPASAADQFANRLRKNRQHLGRTMRRQDVTCYRVYDADLPDYAFAVDIYEHWVHVQEYAAPAEVEPLRAQQRLNEALRIIPAVLEVLPANVHLKLRQRQRGAAQYTRQAARGRFHEVREGDIKFLVNLTDYLDTGLFLDGRLTRAVIREAAKGQSFLNLFAYTGTASVVAARGGAASTTSIDLSQTYLDWARRNFEINHLQTNRNHLIQADVLEWIGRPHDGKHDSPGVYDLIYLDPPTFSNSKRMGRATFDVQRDHADLIRLVVRRLLAPEGVLWFASNSRRFTMDVANLPGLVLRDLSKATLAPDFKRAARMHHLWQIERHEEQDEK